MRKEMSSYFKACYNFVYFFIFEKIENYIFNSFFTCRLLYNLQQNFVKNMRRLQSPFPESVGFRHAISHFKLYTLSLLY